MTLAHLDKAHIVEAYACPDRAAVVRAELARLAAPSELGPGAGGNALARHIADVGEAGLYPQPPFGEVARQRAGEIDGWLDFGLTAVRVPTSAALSGAAQQEKKAGTAALLTSLKVLDGFLCRRTFLVGEAVSLADVALAVDLGAALEQVLRHQDGADLPHVRRWFLTIRGLPQVFGVLGPAKLPREDRSIASSPASSSKQGAGGAAGKAAPAAAAAAAGLPVARGEKPTQPAKPKEPSKPKPGGKAKQPAMAKPGEADEKKKETKLGILARKSGDFAEWYTQVCTVSEMISYYDVSGCYILRPWAYSVWESIMRWFDAQIKELGVENACFPLFVTEDALTKEKDHVEGFAAEVAWVTRSGKSELPRPIAIRPTSETVMYPYFAQWIRSWRDMPLKLNQWTNVVRWEFSNPTPFIRTREFLWQEGHTAYATRQEAEEDVFRILDLYARVYTDLMAVPVTKGYKSRNEQFAGSLFSTSVEGFIEATGRGIQGATSHALGQNFSRMFGIEFEAADKSSQLAWQNSWGLSTRTIGVMIMVHGDDKGLVMPPRVAPVQVIVIPIPNSKLSKEDSQALLDKAAEFVASLKAAGLRVRSDTRDIYTPGWKYANWETKGVPVRLAIGHKDMQKQTVELARRDTGAKEFVAWPSAVARVLELLDAIQADMYEKALRRYDACKEIAHTWDEFMAALGRKHMVLAPWCDEVDVEKQVKVDSSGFDAAGAALMGAKTLCIPLDQPPLPPGCCCFKTGRPAKNWALWGRSY